MWTSLKWREYRKYPWRGGELFGVILQAIGITVFLAYFFYRSLWAFIPLSVVGIAYFRLEQQRRIDKRKEMLLVQFKECILSVSASLQAGYAIENAFMESRKDMQMLYGEQAMIYQELEVIRRGLVINITLEKLLEDFANRSDCEEIRQFTQIVSIAKRSGGNLSEIIYTSSEMIGQRIDAKQEIRVLLSGRRMEQNIMKCMPFAILFYVGMSYPGYFDMLYHNWQGVSVMTGCLLLYLGAYMLGDKILSDIMAQMMS